jgi:hypothetical protein
MLAAKAFGPRSLRNAYFPQMPDVTAIILRNCSIVIDILANGRVVLVNGSVRVGLTRGVA